MKKLPSFLKIIKNILGVTIVFVSTFVFFTQVFFPSFTAFAQKEVYRPVTDDYFSNIAEKRVAVFEFTELTRTPEELTAIDMALKQKAPPTQVVDGITLTQGKRQTGSFSLKNEKKEVPDVFYLSVPKLGIERMEVETNSIDASPQEMLGHYKGSSYPDEPGNTFIYGHSSLTSQFDPSNVKTAFSQLPKLEKGDIIIIEYNGEALSYIVDGSEVVEPEDLKPLDKSYLHYSSISLMTCVPPGTVDKRMVVFAKRAY